MHLQGREVHNGSMTKQNVKTHFSASVYSTPRGDTYIVMNYIIVIIYLLHITY